MLEVDQQTVDEQPRITSKRPRVGSSSNVDIRPPPKFGPFLSYSTGQDPFGLGSGLMGRDCTSDLFKAPSGSEVELETNAESATNHGGSTIAQSIDSRPKVPSLDPIDNDSTQGPTTFRESSKASTLRPS